MSWAERLTMAKTNVRHALLELRTRRWPPGVIESGEASAHRYEPWPVDRTELMLWLVRSDAEPWVPTLAQLDQLRDERTARANAMPKVIPGGRELLNRIPPKEAYRGIPAAEIR